MGLLKPAQNMTAYAKIGILGFQGSGKTYTACNIARGLADLSKSKKIAFFDTEKGSDFEVPRMKKLGYDFLVFKGRAFADLIQVIKEVEKEKIDVLLIDSISHIWRDLADSYQTKAKKKYLSMMDWNVLKKQWKEYTDLFVNSPIHILMLGRAGYMYDQQTNEDGRKEMIKTGTKMKVEGETGYEPDLLIEMEAVQLEGKIINRAFVVKDRSDTINGQCFEYPTFKTFESFFSFLNLGGSHIGIDVQRDSQALFDDPDWSHVELQRRRDIALEELNAALIKAGLDGTSTDAKKKRVILLEKHFTTASKAAIENVKIKDLERIVCNIKLELQPPFIADSLKEFDPNVADSV